MTVKDINDIIKLLEEYRVNVLKANNPVKYYDKSKNDKIKVMIELLEKLEVK